MPQEFASNPRLKSSEDLRIGVLYGGLSSERKISIRSGRAVTRGLKAAGFKTLHLDPRNASLFKRRLKQIDLAFLALHGKGGEDGQIQALLERARIPYIGADVRGSRNAFDKILSKKIFTHAGIPTAKYQLITRKTGIGPLKRMRLPLFVKPPKEGSSIGAFAVEDFAKDAVKVKNVLDAFGELLVEPKIEGRELTVGILGNQALPVIEMKPKSGFYDYHAKYTKGMTEYEVPARIPIKLAKQLQKIALKTHKALGLRDLSRVDIMVDQAGKPYVLEANSIPGFTELSLLPKAAKCAGISFENLCTRLVAFAWQRKNKVKRK
jgi:D-alanine-D-alanine ligase